MKQEMQVKLFTQLLSHPHLLQKYRYLFSSELFTYPPVSILFKSLLWYWDKYHRIVEKPILQYITLEYAKKYPASALYVPVFTEILSLDGEEDEYAYDTLLEILRKKAYDDYAMKVVTKVGKEQYEDLLLDLLQCEEVAERDEKKLLLDFERTDLEQRKRIYIEEYVNVPRLPTPVSELNSPFGGGIGRSRMATLMAPTSFGKTTFAVIFGHYARLLGFFVLHITIEESLEDTAMRYDSAMLKRRLDKEIKHYSSVIEDQQIVLDSISEANLGNLVIVELDPCRPSDILTWIRRVKMEYRPQNLFVIIDYADLIRLEGRREKTIEETTEVFSFLKQIVKREDIWMMNLSQGTRKSAYKRIIRAEDIADDYNKARLSAYIITICVTPEEEQLGVRRLFIAKNRFGRRYVEIPVKVNWDTYELLPLTESEKQKIEDIRGNY